MRRRPSWVFGRCGLTEALHHIVIELVPARVIHSHRAEFCHGSASMNGSANSVGASLCKGKVLICRIYDGFLHEPPTSRPSPPNDGLSYSSELRRQTADLIWAKRTLRSLSVSALSALEWQRPFWKPRRPGFPDAQATLLSEVLQASSISAMSRSSLFHSMPSSLILGTDTGQLFPPYA